MRSEGLDLRSKRHDLWSERPDLGSERPDVGSERDLGAYLRLGEGECTPETEENRPVWIHIDHLSLRGRGPKRITIHLSRRDNELTTCQRKK